MSFLNASLPQSLLVYLGAWGGLALLRWRRRHRHAWEWVSRPAPAGSRAAVRQCQHRLAFTGWTLLWEVRLPVGALLPVDADDNNGRVAPPGSNGGGGGGGTTRRRGSKDGGGPTPAVLLFLLGQVGLALFLVWNLLVTLRDSTFFSVAAAAAGEHRRLAAAATATAAATGAFHVATRVRPMGLLGLGREAGSGGGGGGGATAGWRYVGGVGLRSRLGVGVAVVLA